MAGPPKGQVHRVGVAVKSGDITITRSNDQCSMNQSAMKRQPQRTQRTQRRLAEARLTQRCIALPDLYSLSAYVLLLFSEFSVSSVAVVSGAAFPPTRAKAIPLIAICCLTCRRPLGLELGNERGRRRAQKIVDCSQTNPLRPLGLRGPDRGGSECICRQARFHRGAATGRVTGHRSSPTRKGTVTCTES